MPESGSRLSWWPDSIARSGPAGIQRNFAQTALGLLDQGVIALGAILPIVLLGHLAGADHVGLYSLAVALALFLTIACQSLLLSGYPIFHAMEKATSGLSLFFVLLLGAAVLFLLFPLLLAVVGYFPRLDSGAAIPRMILSAFIVSAVARNYLRGVSLARQDLVQALVLDAIALLFIVLLLAWLAFNGAPQVWSVLGALLFANAVFGLAWLWTYRRRITPQLSGALRYLARSVEFGKWAFVSVAFGSMSYYAAPWLLALMRGTEETAVYASASTVVGIVNHGLLGLTKGIEGRTADAYQRGGTAGLQASLNELFKLVLPGLVVIVVVVFVGADALGALVLPAHASEVATVARILSLALLIGSVRVICGNGLWAMSLPRATVPADLVRGVMCVVFGSFGAYFAGPVGVAFAVLASDLAASAVVVRKYRLIVGAANGR